MRASTLLVAIATAVLALPASAGHCTTYSNANPEFAAGGYYADQDCVWDCISVWVYQESNGIEGLQRADEVVDNTCHGLIAGDTIIF